MKVKIGNSYSKTQIIPSGVPQRPVLRLFLFLIFINNLHNHITLELKLFADDIKLLVRPLSKEITQMNLNKLSYWEDTRIWKLRFNIEKCQVLYIRSKNIKVEYKLTGKSKKSLRNAI